MKLKWLINSTAIALLIVVAFIGLASRDSVMAAQDVGSKIDSTLIDRFATEGSADFIVRFTEQADLSAAYSMDWQARGEYVYNTLVETANRSQVNAKAILDERGVKYETIAGGNDLYVWKGMPADAEALAALPEVFFIRAPRTFQIDPITTNKPFDNVNWAGDLLAGNLYTSVGSSPTAVTDWGILDTEADQAWLLGARGGGIKVANIDTGVQWNHPALQDSFACATGSDPDCWGDPSNVCGGTACDLQGHGTHTMGTMVANDDPSLLYIAGMAPDASWIACLGCDLGSSCSEYALTTCATWMLAPGGDSANRPDVVNNSWGGGGGDAWYQSYVQNWVADGIFPAFSAGNSTGCSSMGSPGDYQESFASTGHTSTRVHVYAQGPSPFGHDPYTKPNISAPAVSICSTVPTDSWSCGYSGTSMASPHSAGAVAQIWSVCPDFRGNIDATFQLLQDNADPPDPPTPSCGVPPDGQGTYEDGYGYLDVRAAVQTCAQGFGFGAINGHVYDQDGEPVEGAMVSAVPSLNDNNTQAVTDPSGYYTMTLVANTYDVTASKLNYLPQTIYGIEVVTDTVVTQDFEITALGSWTDAPATCFDLTRIDAEYYPATGLVYIMGGRGGPTGGDTIPNIYSYNPVTQECLDTGADMPDPVSNYTINLVNDGSADVLCTFGGRASTGSSTASVQCYNPLTNNASIVTTLPAAYAGFTPGAQVVVDNMVYVFGGFRNTAAPYELARTDRYDPVTHNFTQIGDLSLARSYIDAAVVDGAIYAFGGTVFDGASLNAQTRAEVMADPGGAGTWDDAAVADLPLATAEGRAFGFDTGVPFETAGKIVIAGGGQWPGETNAVFTYDVASDTYDDSFPDLNHARRDQAGVFVPGDPATMWVFGGRQGVDTPPYQVPEFFELPVLTPQPNIRVEAPPLDAVLPPDATMTMTVNIKNTGDLPLNWSLNEVPGMMIGKSTVQPHPKSGIPVQLGVDAINNPNPEAATWTPSGPISLVLDDGAPETAVGIGGTWEFIWLNRFTPDPVNFPFEINTVSVYWPSFGLVQVGDTMTLVVFENTSGSEDPAVGANFLASIPVTVQTLSVFNNYTLPTPVTITGPGDVLVGVIDTEVPGTSYYPAAMDRTVSQRRSWVGWWSFTPPPEPPTLPPDAAWTLADDIGATFAGNWLVRASGETTGVDVPWLSEDPIAGMLGPGESQDVVVTFDSTGLTLGEYLASLDIHSNDPDTPVVNLPVSLNVKAESDLSVTKTDNPDPVYIDRPLTYTLTVENLGPMDATGVKVVDNLPPSVTNIQAPGCIVLDHEVTCDIGALADGDKASVDIVVTAPHIPGTITNTVTVMSEDVIDPIPGNDTATEDTYVSLEPADLAVSKTSDPNPVKLGESLTYTIVVANLGSGAATGVKVVDTLPDSVTDISAPGCSRVGFEVTCALGSLPAGDTIQRTITVTAPDVEGTLTNTAVVSGNEPDPDPDNNTVTQLTVVRPPFYYNYLPIVFK